MSYDTNGGWLLTLLLLAGWLASLLATHSYSFHKPTSVRVELVYLTEPRVCVFVFLKVSNAMAASSLRPPLRGVSAAARWQDPDSAPQSSSPPGKCCTLTLKVQERWWKVRFTTAIFLSVFTIRQEMGGGSLQLNHTNIKAVPVSKCHSAPSLLQVNPIYHSVYALSAIINVLLLIGPCFTTLDDLLYRQKEVTVSYLIIKL